ncbi:hypothetical protein EVAR_16836_1 [Eumeta japonica]|uniref:Uncharacterized protein n=1 Tax=Eumeta variegata TaxID=151549 RepID=A0A4C1V3M1_EUMVA|nr:hypothetical protein EVAR_16836_1 [Eumeta japonica]
MEYTSSKLAVYIKIVVLLLTARWWSKRIAVHGVHLRYSAPCGDESLERWNPGGEEGRVGERWTCALHHSQATQSNDTSAGREKEKENEVYD